MKTLFRNALALALLPLAGQSANADLINPSFETPAVGVTTVGLYPDASQVGGFPGWRTTATDHKIELWSMGYNGVTSYDGDQHVELNATQVSTLYQDATGISAGSLVGYEFAHRGRAGVDTMRLTITDLGLDNTFGTTDDTILFTNLYTDGNTAWGHYTDGGATLTALGNDIRFAYESVAAAGGNQAIGNFIDGAHFGVTSGTLAVPEPGSVALFVGMASMGRMMLRKRRNK